VPEIPITVIGSRHPDAPRPRVSVAMITYNHEKFIEQSVESVMMQQTNFPFELVISEDCSTDRTRELVLGLQKKYPERIRLLLPERNLGAKQNWLQNLQACDGEYIAMLEGDDFWISQDKLKQQVELLDKNPAFSACFTRAEVITNGASSKPHSIPANNPARKVLTTDDLIERNSIPTCSLLFRNVVLELDLEPFRPLAMGDWPLNVLLSLRGLIGYSNKVMAAYRQHDGGIWTGRDEAARLVETVKFYVILKQVLPAKYAHRLSERIVKTHQLIALELLKRGDRRQARNRVFRSLAAIPPASLFSFGWFIRRSLLLFLGVYGMSLSRVEAGLRR
jgi:glycosyltransferase involved in cell wall biosynthesis